MSDQSYLHGFNETERQRLLHQAEFLAPLVYDGVDFSRARSILEIGSGVGAQTLQLLQRYPKLQITCIELAETQIESAKRNLKDYVSSGQVRLIQSSAEEIPLETMEFDGVFICWLLEHVRSPLRVLQEAYRVMQPNAQLYAREVFNTLFYLGPDISLLIDMWNEFNLKQIEMGGDPYVGAKLGGLLTQAGFQSIDVAIKPQLHDRRGPTQRKAYLDYWENLFASGFTGDDAKTALVRSEFAKLKANDETTFVFGYAAAEAKRS